MQAFEHRLYQKVVKKLSDIKCREQSSTFFYHQPFGSLFISYHTEA
ncbi:hypothetical protein CUZ96_1289 [Enterococcus lactis]|uniref:Uncharacterized protein n=2 Tax=Enterococcus faecium TaxID=1352 RepID=J6Z318_ENTFC|nr:hypothetical protein EfmE980_0553 [Enterococcus faecium E980]EJY47854.1 hypothetical protein HMPREF1348_00291 [Enterococcus faecium 505]EPI13892.1 hypothetical protein D356_00994 [Enterococcus faecium SD2A-2]MBL4988691.1 hypothetical protein [Enterococcus lactis]MBL4991599.1 hypothetical protein [Enterococcus lactis]